MLSRCLRALLFVPTVATALHAQSSKITTYVRYAVDGQTSYGRVVGTTVQQLRAALYEAETRCAQVEQKVREEVTEEMEAQMKEMDLVFAIRMENERISVEER